MIGPSTSSGNAPTPCHYRPGTTRLSGRTPASAAPSQVQDNADESLAFLLSRGAVLHRELYVSPPTSSEMIPHAASSASFIADIIQEALDLIGEDDLDAVSSSEYFCSGADDTRNGSTGSLPQ